MKLIFGENWAKYQGYSLTFWRKLADLATFQSTIKSVKLIFGENWAKYQGYSLTFWRKLADFSHFSVYNQNLWNWFLVKIGQNTKAIALLFGENWLILATFQSTIKICEIDFWWKLAKYQGYSLTFWRKLADFSHFSVYNQNLWNWFLVKIGQNTKAIALLFGENWLILATFQSTIKICEIDFWWKMGKIPRL